MERSRDDRMIAGVCGGLARYLNVDPVVVRVVTAALTVVGGVGFVLYIAAWLLVPEEGSARSIVAARTRSDGSDRKVRTVGLVIAAVLAIAAVASAGPWWGWSFPWGLAVIAFVVWLILGRAEGATTPQHAALDVVAVEAGTGATAIPPPARPTRPSRGDGSLAWLTIGAGLIAAGVLWLVDRGGAGVEWPDYVALGLAVVGLGVLIGTWRGAGRRLIPLGALLAFALLISAQLPTLSAGDVRATPASAADVDPAYEHGAGSFLLDLTEIEDPTALDGRTISIDQGMGKVEIVVPDDIDVSVGAHVDMGHMAIFDREASGWDTNLDWRDDASSRPDVNLVIDLAFGEARVLRP